MLVGRRRRAHTHGGGVYGAVIAMVVMIGDD